MRYRLTLESIFPIVKSCCCETGFRNTHPLTTIPLPVFDMQTRFFIHPCRNPKEAVFSDNAFPPKLSGAPVFTRHAG